MPVYEYICGKCGKHFEKRQSFEDEPVAQCPACSTVSKRLIQCVPVIFKGSGFYVTDYKKESICPSTSGEKKEPSDAACASCPESKKEPAASACAEARKPEAKTTETPVKSK